MKEHRIFVEWSDPGAYVSSLSPDFQAELAELVEQYGPPTLVEFRAHGEGWVEGRPEDSWCDACQVPGHLSCGGDHECDCCAGAKA